MRSGIFKTGILLCIVVLLTCAAGIVAHAAPAAGIPELLKQPTGQSFTAVLNGDEWFHYWSLESSGFVIVQGEDGVWYYAQGLNGQLAAGTNKVGIDPEPVEGIKKDSLPVKNTAVSKRAMALGNEAPPLPQSNLAGKRHKLIVLLVEFSDIEIKYTDAEWHRQIFALDWNSVNRYYDEVSNGSFHFDPAGETAGDANDGVIKVKLNYPHPNTFDFDNKGEQIRGIVRDALKAADPHIDYKAFDQDGNKYISSEELHIVTVPAGYDRSYDVALTPRIWAHSWSFKDNENFELDEVYLCDGTAGKYTMQGEQHGDHMATIGVLCHEIGHNLGLPDMYDTDGSSYGIGVHSLMASGMWTRATDENMGSTPTHLDPWCKLQLGFIQPKVAAGAGDYELPGTGRRDYTVLKVPTSQPDEYFLVENRQFSGFDKSLMYSCKSGGIAIWHVDEAVMRNKYHDNSVNNTEAHKAMDLEEANEGEVGHSQLDYKDAMPKDGYDHYYRAGGFTTFSPSTRPGSKLYTMADSYVTISSQDISKGVMKVSVRRSNLTPELSVVPGQVEGREGGTATVQVQFKNVFDLKALNLLLSYDPQILAVKNTTPGAISGTIRVDTSTPGAIQMTADLQPSASFFTGLPVLSLEFDLLKIGKSALTIDSYSLTNTDNTTISAITSGSSITVKELLGAVAGTVKLEGKREHAGVIVTVEGTTLSAITDADGKFKLEDVQPGPKVVTLSHPSYATVRKTDLVFEKGVTLQLGTETEPVILKWGDLDGNGRIDQADLQILGNTYRAKTGDSHYNPAVDMTGDNRIDLADFGFMASNLLSQPNPSTVSKNAGGVASVGIKLYELKEEGPVEIPDFSGWTPETQATYEARISLQGATGFKGLDFVIGYDTGLVDITTCSAIQAMGVTVDIATAQAINSTEGAISYSAANAAATDMENAEVLRIQFKVKEAGVVRLYLKRHGGVVFIDNVNRKFYPVEQFNLIQPVQGTELQMAAAWVELVKESLRMSDYDKAVAVVTELPDVQPEDPDPGDNVTPAAIASEAEQALLMELAAVRVIIDRIDMDVQLARQAVADLPLPEAVKLVNESAIRTARRMVNDAWAMGAAEYQMGGLQKLEDCEYKLAKIKAQLLKAETAVIKAETTRLLEDIQAAKTLVDGLPEANLGNEKSLLSDRLNAVLDAVAKEQAGGAVSKAETTRQLSDILAAYLLVDRLPEGAERTAYKQRLLTVHLEIASSAVGTAKATKRQQDLDAAMNIVKEIPAEGAEQKTALLGELSALQQTINIRETAERAMDAIALLPEPDNVTLGDKAAIENARGLVNAAIAAGARNTDILNLSRLAACEAKLRSLETPPPPPPPPVFFPSGPALPPPPPPVKYEVEGNRVKLAKDVSTDTNKARYVLEAKDMEDILTQVKADGNGRQIILLELKEAEGKAGYELQLPADALRNAPKRIYEIITPAGTVRSGGDSLKAGTAAQNVVISLTPAERKGFSRKYIAMVGARPVVDLQILADGTPVESGALQNAISVFLPYTPGENEAAEPDYIGIWHMNGTGDVVPVCSGRYDAAKKGVSFSTQYLGVLGVTYVRKNFTDLDKFDWARKGIETMASKGVLGGTSTYGYDPGKPITKADFAVLLVRALDLTAEVDDNFDDIPENAYYYKAVGILKKLGISAGIGNNQYGAKTYISRQDMMVLVVKAMKLAGKVKESGKKEDLAGYSDSAAFSSYAVTSAATLAREGLLPWSGGRLNPKVNATRADVAMILYNAYMKK